MSKYTPGPWVENDGFIFAESTREPVAETPPYDGTESAEFFERMDANVRLICAAPELLEALKLLEAEMVASGNAGSTDYGWLPAIEKTRSAIAKATQP